MAPPKAGFGKREDRPMPPWARSDGEPGAPPPRRRWVMKREAAPRNVEPAQRERTSAECRAALIAARAALTPRARATSTRMSHPGRQSASDSVPDTVDDAARAQSTGRAFSVRVDNDPIDETLDERLFPDRFEGKLMGDNLRHSETGWADLGGRQLDHDPPTAVAPHDCDASVENPPVQAAPARLSRFFRVKRPKPRASRARVEAEPSYEQNYETYYDDEPPTTLAAGSVLTPAPAEELDLALAEELYTGRPPGESAAPQPRRFSIPAWALAGIIGILAIPLLMMTGASSALTGSGTAPAGGLIASIQKWFESPPLPACPAGLVRAPDKKCWPIQRKIEPVTEVGAETPPVALPLEDVATDLAAKKPTMPSVGVSDASAVTRVTPPPASSNTGRSNAGRPKAVAPAGAKADKPSSGKLAIGKSVPTSAAAGPKKLPAANARSASNRSPG